MAGMLQAILSAYDQQRASEPVMAPPPPGYNHRAGEWQKGKGMRPEVAAALMGLGQGLGQLGAGQPVNMTSALNSGLAHRAKASGGGGGGGGSVRAGGNGMASILNDPVKKAAFMDIAKRYPQLAERMMVKSLLGIDLPKPAAPVKGVEVDGSLLNPYTGEVIYQGAPQQDYKYIDGVGMVDMNAPPPELMAGQFQPPAEQNLKFIEGVGMVDMNNPPPELLAENYQKPPPEAPGFEDTQKLRKEWASQNKNFKTQAEAVARMMAAAETDSGPGDIALLFAFMKAQDPESVVRESEFATAENAGGVSEKVRNLYNRVKQGERLTPEVRQEFLRTAMNIYSEAERAHMNLRAQFENIAGAGGFDISQALPDYRYKSPYAPSTSPVPQGRPEPTQPNSELPPPPPGYTPEMWQEVWEVMTPENRALFQ